ncbi:Protein CYP-33C5 [Aphelenchoides avenae]|nr:Protein CYP-33C5 [Aphelenchus avenae]
MLFWLFTAFVTGLLFYNYYFKRRNFPPGPTPHPLIGNGLDLGPNTDWHETFKKWRRKYGDVYTIWFGEMPVVCADDYRTIIDAYQRDGDAHSDRLKSTSEFHELVRGGVFGVIDTWGDLWREQRRFALHMLRDFGLGKDLMERRVLEEVSAAVASLARESQVRNDVDVMRHVEKSVASIINVTLLGYPFRKERQEEYAFVKKSLEDFVKSFSDPLILTAVRHPNFFRRLPFFKQAFDRLLKPNRKLFDHFEQKIREHHDKLDFESDQPPSDYVDAFLREMHRRDQNGEHHYFTYDQLKNMCMDLWLGGQETTNVTLAWGITYLTCNADVQKELQAELDAVVGSDRLIAMSDRTQLPFTCAVVNEIQRLGNIFPINGFRETTRDTTIGGYRIPKDTCTLPQIGEVMYDEKIFPDPHVFNPRRFLDSECRLKKIDEFLPFSLGKRQCLGEGLARMELFLFIANLFNKFEFTAGSKAPATERKYSFFVKCAPFTCRLTKRWIHNGAV